MLRRYKIEFMIPLFPLQIVVFPEEMINLHIFEPKYRQLVRDCMSDGLPFGIVPFINGAIQKVGTLMQINSIEKTYEDGRMDIKTQSKGLFEIEELFKPYPGKLYAGAKVRKFENEDNGDPQLSRQIYNQLSEVFQILNISKKLKPADILASAVISRGRILALHAIIIASVSNSSPSIRITSSFDLGNESFIRLDGPARSIKSVGPSVLLNL